MDEFYRRYRTAARRRREEPPAPCQDSGAARCCPACREQDLRVVDCIRAAAGGLCVVRRRCASCGKEVSRLENEQT
jgi:hypothetical protein